MGTRRDAVRRARSSATEPAAVDPADPWSQPWDDEPRRPLVRRVAGGTARLLAGIVLIAAVAVAGFTVGAFLRYLDGVDGFAPPALSTVARADAIAVLTGGSDRIAAGGRLLETGRADRLLVSGVNPAATERQVRGLLGVGPDLFRCCVTLGFAALDTRGNAGETARWLTGTVSSEGDAPRVIVVTANYHMQRALLELSRAMPGVILDPYPVKGVDLGEERWWTDAAKLRVILGEFVKLQLARVGDVPVIGATLGSMLQPVGLAPMPEPVRGDRAA